MFKQDTNRLAGAEWRGQRVGKQGQGWNRGYTLCGRRIDNEHEIVDRIFGIQLHGSGGRIEPVVERGGYVLGVGLGCCGFLAGDTVA